MNRVRLVPELFKCMKGNSRITGAYRRYSMPDAAWLAPDGMYFTGQTLRSPRSPLTVNHFARASSGIRRVYPASSDTARLRQRLGEA